LKYDANSNSIIDDNLYYMNWKLENECNCDVSRINGYVSAYNYLYLKDPNEAPSVTFRPYPPRYSSSLFNHQNTIPCNLDYQNNTTTLIASNLTTLEDLYNFQKKDESDYKNGNLFKSDKIKSNVEENITNISSDSNLNSIYLYPNPFKTSFNIECVTPCNIEIYNSTGIKIYNELLFDNVTNISLNNESAGIYLVKVTIDKDYKYNKRIKLL
jgi:hypothetical protein